MDKSSIAQDGDTSQVQPLSLIKSMEARTVAAAERQQLVQLQPNGFVPLAFADDIQHGEMLCRGSLCTVYMASWKTSRPQDLAPEPQQSNFDPSSWGSGIGAEVTGYHWQTVALVTPQHRHVPGPSQEMQVLEQARMLKLVQHPHVVGLRAVCLRPPALLLEHCNGGCSEGRLVQFRQTASAGAVLQLLRDVASAVSHLHSVQLPGKHGLIHGDLRMANLWLTADTEQNWSVKLAGFDLAAWLNPTCGTVTVPAVTNHLWVAPEVLKTKRSPICRGPFTISRASEVWMFGMLMWEALAGQPPYLQELKRLPGGERELIRFLNPYKQLGPLEFPDTLLYNFSNSQQQQLKQLYQDITQLDPSQRPSMTEVYERLEAMCEQAQQEQWQRQYAGMPLKIDSSSGKRTGGTSTKAVGEIPHTPWQDDTQQQLWQQRKAKLKHHKQAIKPSAPFRFPKLLRKPPPPPLPPLLPLLEQQQSIQPPLPPPLQQQQQQLCSSVAVGESSDRAASDGAAEGGSTAAAQAASDTGGLDSLLGADQLGTAGSVSPAATEADLPHAECDAVGTAGEQQSTVDELAASVAALQQLQPELVLNPFQQLLLLWTLSAVRCAVSPLQFYVQRQGPDCLTPSQFAHAPDSDTGQPAAAAPVHRLACDVTTKLKCLQLQLRPSANGLQQQQQQQHREQMTTWQLLLLAWELHGMCLKLESLGEQLLIQAGLTSAVVERSSWRLLSKSPATAAELLLQWQLPLAVMTVALALLLEQWPLRVLLGAAVAVCAAVAARQAWPQLMDNTPPLQQQQQQAGQEQRLEQLAFPQYDSSSEVPVQDIRLSVKPDCTSSAMAWIAWGVCSQPTAQTACSGNQHQEQPQQQQLLCTLPQHCYGTEPRHHMPPAPANNSAASSDAVGQRDQHNKKQQQADSTAAEHHVALADHPTLSCPFSAALKPPTALLSQLHRVLSAQADASSAIMQQGFEGALGLCMFVPVCWMCQQPPMLLLDTPPESTLAAWLQQCQQQQQQQQVDGASGLGGGGSSSMASINSSRGSTRLAPFPATEWPQVLRWLHDVAAALQQLHKHDITHGAVHAASVHLHQQQGPTERIRCRLSLVEPWLRSFMRGRVVDPALSPPELLIPTPSISSTNSSTSSWSSRNRSSKLASGPATDPYSSPAVDVYGLGMLMWQLATGWLPQHNQPQQGPSGQVAGFEVIEEVNWCDDMLERYKTTFPGAPATAAAAAAGGGGATAAAAEANRGTTASLGANQLGSGDASIEAWPEKHGSLPSCADGWLPSGFRRLMYHCCSTTADARPSLQKVKLALEQMLDAPHSPNTEQRQQQPPAEQPTEQLMHS